VGVAAGDEALGSGVALAVGEAVGGALEVATDGDGLGPGSGSSLHAASAPPTITTTRPTAAIRADLVMATSCFDGTPSAILTPWFRICAPWFSRLTSAGHPAEGSGGLVTGTFPVVVDTTYGEEIPIGTINAR